MKKEKEKIEKDFSFTDSFISYKHIDIYYIILDIVYHLYK